jgi:hypothetical protein
MNSAWSRQRRVQEAFGLLKAAASIRVSWIAICGVGRVSSSMQLPAELALGRSKLKARFRDLPPSIVKAGESLAAVGGSSGAIYRLRSGWACQFGDPCSRRQAIVDVYLPGDVIGLDFSAQHAAPWGDPDAYLGHD